MFLASLRQKLFLQRLWNFTFYLNPRLKVNYVIEYLPCSTKLDVTSIPLSEVLFTKITKLHFLFWKMSQIPN